MQRTYKDEKEMKIVCSAGCATSMCLLYKQVQKMLREKSGIRDSRSSVQERRLHRNYIMGMDEGSWINRFQLLDMDGTYKYLFLF